MVFLVFAGIMYVLAKFLPAGNFEFFGREVLLKFIVVLAILIICIAILQFFGKHTTVNPHRPENTKALITSGIYNYPRNPMYLGMLLFLIALGLHLQNAFNTLIVGGFVFYMNRFQIMPEEEMLTQKFGQEYKLYTKLVRRWF